MKKLFKTFMVMLLLVPCMMGLVACGNDGGGFGGGTGGGGTGGGEDDGGEAGGGGTPGSYTEVVTFDEDFVWTSNDGDITYTIKKDGNNIYSSREEDGSILQYLYVMQGDETYNGYYKLSESSDWVATGNTDEYGNVHGVIQTVRPYMMSYAAKIVDDDTEMTSAGTASIAGVSCTIYQYSEGGYVSKYWTYKGLTLKAVLLIGLGNSEGSEIINTTSYSSSAVDLTSVIAEATA